MSTLSIPTPRTPAETGVDSRFDALVRATGLAQRPAPTHDGDGVDFETAFDLDYWQPVREVRPSGFAPVVHEPCAPRPARSLPAQPTRGRRDRMAAPASPTAVPVGARVRLTRRGRTVLVLATLALALGAMVLLAGWATASLTGGTPEPVRVIEVAPGDTLYGIAGDLAEPGEVREMVHRIQELNSLSGAQISEGQKLAVPRG
jgi:hypothetical protein